MSVPWERSGVDQWTEQAALEHWLEDLEGGDAIAEMVRASLEAEPANPSASRELCYREAAARWLERGQPQVALALLDRSRSGTDEAREATSESPDKPGNLRAQLDRLGASLPGLAGLPALTDGELTELRGCSSPDEALEVLAGARVRLEHHGQEARRLLRRWLARQRSR